MIDVAHMPRRCVVETPSQERGATGVYVPWGSPFRNRHEAEAAAQAAGLTQYRLRVLP